MMIDPRRAEIKLKLVYYGPSFSGKTTNLVQIHEKYKGKKGDLVIIDTEGERTLFFDLLPLEIFLVPGFKVRTFLHTVPGQVFYKISRRLVLKGADGVVYVADSQRNRMDENIEILHEMYKNFEANKLKREKIPIVFQYNKRDLHDILPVEELEKELNPEGHPHVEAIAIRGIGVFRTLEELIKKVVEDRLCIRIRENV